MIKYETNCKLLHMFLWVNHLQVLKHSLNFSRETLISFMALMRSLTVSSSNHICEHFYYFYLGGVIQKVLLLLNHPHQKVKIQPGPEILFMLVHEITWATLVGLRIF